MKAASSHRPATGFLVAAGLLAAVAIWQFPKFDAPEKSQSPAGPESGQDAAAASSPGHLAESSEGIEARKFRQLSEQILGLLATGSEIDINRVYFELVPALVRLDPAAAAAFAESQKNPLWRDQLMMVVAQSWAAIDPDEAQDWAADLPNPPGRPTERDTVVSYVSFEVAKTDPARAVKVLSDTNINAERREIMIENLAQQWARRDLQPLADWIASMPPGPDRDSLFARIANSMAQSDPAKAAEMVSKNIAPGPVQDQAVLNILRQWAWMNPGAATEWVKLFPRNEFYDVAMREINDANARRHGLNPPPPPGAAR